MMLISTIRGFFIGAAVAMATINAGGLDHMCVMYLTGYVSDLIV